MGGVGVPFREYLGIALMVYHYFFKLLGLILFAIEIGWFIVFPLVGELKIWWALRGEIVARRWVWYPRGAGCFITVLFVPWSDRIRIPAVLESTPNSTIYAPTPGRIVELAVKEGMQVGKRDRLLCWNPQRLKKIWR